MPLRAVLFDVGETLVHPAPSFPELFSDVVAGAGHARSPGAVVDASRAVFHRFSEAARDAELWTTSPERSARFWKGVYERMLTELEIGDGGLVVAAFQRGLAVSQIVRGRYHPRRERKRVDRGQQCQHPCDHDRERIAVFWECPRRTRDIFEQLVCGLCNCHKASIG
jgi:phosphoglycolate phosphatase-like HAD superfamily hydrolase